MIEAVRRQAIDSTFGGVVYARQQRVAIGDLVNDLRLLSEATDETYWRSRVEFLPL